MSTTFSQSALLKIAPGQCVPIDAIYAVAQTIVEKFAPEKIILS